MERKETMSTRENILSALRANAKALPQPMPGDIDPYAMPDWEGFYATTYDKPLDEFIMKAQTVSGATVLSLESGESLNEAVRRAYPEAKIIASDLDGVDAQLNPDTVEDVRELMKVDVGVIEGSFGVAENGCIWIPQNMKEKAICFASEYLVILLHRDAIVSNMHEAYDRIAGNPESFGEYNFGVFISGPSKTADIESALVYGAQAARGVTVILV